jgi:hypothetical protein
VYSTRKSCIVFGKHQATVISDFGLVPYTVDWDSKKSDVKRPPVLDYQRSSESSEVGALPVFHSAPRYSRGTDSLDRDQPQTLIELPPASDFRTSLILPE